MWARRSNGYLSNVSPLALVRYCTICGSKDDAAKQARPAAVRAPRDSRRRSALHSDGRRVGSRASDTCLGLFAPPSKHFVSSADKEIEWHDYGSQRELLVLPVTPPIEAYRSRESARLVPGPRRSVRCSHFVMQSPLTSPSRTKVPAPESHGEHRCNHQQLADLTHQELTDCLSKQGVEGDILAWAVQHDIDGEKLADMCKFADRICRLCCDAVPTKMRPRPIGVYGSSQRTWSSSTAVPFGWEGCQLTSGPSSPSLRSDVSMSSDVLGSVPENQPRIRSNNRAVEKSSPRLAARLSRPFHVDLLEVVNGETNWEIPSLWEEQ